VRHASKKGAGSTRNQGKKRTGKRLGLRKYEGEYVKAGHVIVTQRGTRYYSGKNVSSFLDKIKVILTLAKAGKAPTHIISLKSETSLLFMVNASYNDSEF